MITMIDLVVAEQPCYAQDANLPVTAQQDNQSITLDNGIIAICINKRTGGATSLIYHHNKKNIQLSSKHQALYFDVNGENNELPHHIAAKAPRAGYTNTGSLIKSTELTKETPGEAEIVAKGDPGTYFPFGVELHYILRRGISGYYCYAVFRHDAAMSAGSIGQSRVVMRTPRLFTDHIVDEKRQGSIDKSPVVRTVSAATFLLQDGSLYCKYDNSAYSGDHYFHGMTGGGVGVWIINPSNEALNGGPLKQELTIHQDNVLLNMFEGGHFGGGSITCAHGEIWSKMNGPFLVYVNSGASTRDMYNDAKRQTQQQQSEWPYQWINAPNYPVNRGAVSGKIKLSSGESASGAWAILADKGGDWPTQAKNYQFWSKVGDDGSFTISKARPGTYALYIVGGNQFDQFEDDDVNVQAGQTTNLGALTWKIQSYGQKIWQIGTADRLSEEFCGGKNDWSDDGVRHWANFMTYPQKFPNDVTFTIGKSKEGVDWNYAQWTWCCKKPYWSILFSQTHQLKGTATLTFGITAAKPLGGSETHTIIKINDKEIGQLHLKKSGAAAYRSGGSDSLYQLVRIQFDASLIKAGQNEITIGDRDAKPFPSRDEQMGGKVGAVIWDAIRLEVQSQ